MLHSKLTNCAGIGLIKLEAAQRWGHWLSSAIWHFKQAYYECVAEIDTSRLFVVAQNESLLMQSKVS